MTKLRKVVQNHLHNSLRAKNKLCKKLFFPYRKKKPRTTSCAGFISHSSVEGSASCAQHFCTTSGAMR